MKRLIDYHLNNWKNDPYRKPLLIRGARQVGKTYSVRMFGSSFDDIVEINFERKKDAKKIFEKDLVPSRIVEELSVFTSKPIIPGKTLLFLDEIQDCTDAIQSLRYFFEEMPNLHVIAAGSLLDFALEKIGIPVGRVQSLYLYPVSFMEFLLAIDEKLLLDAICNHPEKLAGAEVLHNKALDLIGRYLAIGGMPEAIKKWVETKSPLECFKIHTQLVDNYRQDFQKYAKKHQIPYLEELFQQTPRLIGQQFKYTEIHGEYKKRELQPCLNLLCLAGVLHRVHHSAGNGLPLGAESNPDWFKLIFLDIAICQTILGIDLSTWFIDPRVGFVNKGAIVESFVGQELLCYSMPHKKADLYFWKTERPNIAEVDYLYDHKSQIVPIEAKSKDGRSLKSLHRFLERHNEVPYGVRFSSLNYSIFEKIDSRPLYAVFSLAHDEQKASLQSLIVNS